MYRVNSAHRVNSSHFISSQNPLPRPLINRYIPSRYRFPVLEEDSHNALDLLQARPYASQSGEIFGILNSMLESMNSNFADALAQEQKAAADFAALKEAKTDEIKAGRELLENKESEFADTAEKLAQSKQNLDDTEEQLGADQAFLLDLEKRCKANDGVRWWMR